MSTKMLEINPEARNVIGEAKQSWLRLMPLSIEQYHRMIDEGILPEDTSVELLDGMLVPKDRGDAGGEPMVIGEEHAYVVNQLARLDRQLGELPIHIQTQQPIVIPEANSEPEPDAAIVQRPSKTLGKPFAKDISCVIEVSGTSLQRDRTTKLRHYACGGIPQYFIINLADRTAEEHLNPQLAAGVFANSIVHTDDAILRLHLAGDDQLAVPLADLLPPTTPVR